MLCYALPNKGFRFDCQPGFFLAFLCLMLNGIDKSGEIVAIASVTIF